MIEKTIIETKNKDEALEKYLSENEIKLEDIYLKEKVEEGGLFKSKKTILSIIKKSDVISFIKNYISELSKNMNVSIQSEVRLVDDYYKVTLVTDKNAIIIGKDGKNLDALQMLLKQSLNKKTGMNLKLTLDASNYRGSKQKNFEHEIKKIAKDVLNTKADAKLDPMNSYNRRIVHTIVGEFKNLESESFGETPNRYVVIKYKED